MDDQMTNVITGKPYQEQSWMNICQTIRLRETDVADVPLNGSKQFETNESMLKFIPNFVHLKTRKMKDSGEILPQKREER